MNSATQGTIISVTAADTKKITITPHKYLSMGYKKPVPTKGGTVRY
jgi:hypothetical protein